jgi:hypothetical protein
MEDNSVKDLRNILNEVFRRGVKKFTPPAADKQKVFISISSGRRRAETFAGVGNSVETAFDAAKAKVLKKARNDPAGMPKWIYMAFVTGEEEMTLDELYQQIRGTKRNYYRRGFALDEFYQFAFLEQEVNGAGLIRYGEDESGAILHDHNVTAFLRNKKLIDKGMTFSQSDIQKVIGFRTQSCFFDLEENQYYDLYNDGWEKGIRVIEEADAALLTSLTAKSGQYLKNTVRENGQFVYGYFPVFDKETPGYNIIRHCLSVMALMEMYLLTGDESYKEPIRKTYRFFMGRTAKTGDNTMVVVDQDNKNEVRLGALGLSIIMILMYAEIFGTDEDLDKAGWIAEAILTMQNENGDFTHVLGYPELNVVDQFRVVYYSGEACYGLMRLYARVKDERYLNAVKKAFDFFIANHYEKYYDHWLSYSVNELTQAAPEDRYFEFGLKNVMGRIHFIIDRLTTWTTFMELLNAAFKMIERIKELGKSHLLEGYKVADFYDAISVRLYRQLNGVLFPEMAMFYQNPDRMLYGAFVRHHSFRVRDDDVSHHLIGYCHFIKNLLPFYEGGIIKRVRRGAELLVYERPPGDTYK